jgi:hypothetical protein
LDPIAEDPDFAMPRSDTSCARFGGLSSSQGTGRRIAGGPMLPKALCDVSQMMVPPE